MAWTQLESVLSTWTPTRERLGCGYTPAMRFFAALAVFSAASACAQAPFCAQLQAAIADSPAHWGISVATLDGKPLCQIDAAKLFRPASNNKLFTTAAALAILGPEKTFETTVTGNLDPKTGVVKGDLTLVGGGDPNLASGDLPYNPGHAAAPPFAFHDLEDLAAQLVAKGVKTVTGDIVGDDTLFPYDPLISTWELEDVVSNDGAPVSALTIADNQFKLTVAAGQTKASATASIDQHGIPFYSIVSEAKTGPPKSQTDLKIERDPGSRIIRIYGSIAEDAPPHSEEVSIDESAVYAAKAFRQVLVDHGISVRGSTRAAHNTSEFDSKTVDSDGHPAPDIEKEWLSGGRFESECLHPVPAPTLATIPSAPLSADVVYTDKVSQNLHAELLLRAIGGVIPCHDGTTAAGRRLIRAFLLVEAHLAPDDFILYDGSGLSSHDLVAPRALTTLLAYAATQPWFETFKSALPVGGVDGSLVNRFTGKNQPQLTGKVFAKTGSLGESRALSGYLTAASGQTLVFSIMDDNHPPTTSSDRTLMDHLVELIAAAN